MIALDDAGWLWTFQYDGTSSIGINLIPTDLKLSFPSYQSYQYGSMVVGDDGNLYLSHFTGETNEFYRLVWNEEQEMFISDRIGQVGAEVWPAALYAVESNAATTEAVSHRNFGGAPEAGGADDERQRSHVSGNTRRGQQDGHHDHHRQGRPRCGRRFQQWHHLRVL